MADAQLPEKTVEQLVIEHHALDERLRNLSTLSHLSNQEQYEETALKKQKLAVKDRIETLLRERPAATHH